MTETTKSLLPAVAPVPQTMGEVVEVKSTMTLPSILFTAVVAATAGYFIPKLFDQYFGDKANMDDLQDEY